MADGTGDFVQNDPNTFRILLASDNHLGYAEKDGVRGSDSFNSFEEILHIAKSQNVDLIFFGGDIFHDSRPSMRSVYEAIRLFRTYCMGDNPVKFETLSDPCALFANTALTTSNYLDPNLNVGIPVFAIHGNHDDPSGPGGLSALDILHAAGCINLLGKTSSVESVCVNPLLLRKGSTLLAIYPIGAIREERAHRLFLNNSVTFLRPTEDPDNWFSICAVHQNRSRHGPTSYLPEKFLPNFLDLVIWGHEHECRVEPEWNPTQNFFVVQPGSSVATALSEGEAKAKAVGLLEVRGKEFKVTRIPLKSVRPFVFKDIVIEDELQNSRSRKLDVAAEVQATCARIVEDCLTKLATETADRLKQSDVSTVSAEIVDSDKVFRPPTEPLVRLRVDLSGGYETFSALRFGQRFIGRIANPKDLITFNHNREKLAAAQTKRALTSSLDQESTGHTDDTALLDHRKVGLDIVEVEHLVRNYLCEIPTHPGTDITITPDKLLVFTIKELGRGLERFVDKDTRDAIDTVVDSVTTNTVKHLRVRRCPEDHIVPDIVSFCHSRSSQDEKENDGGEISGKCCSEFEPVHSDSTDPTARDNGTLTVEWNSDEEMDSVPSKKPRGPRLHPHPAHPMAISKRPHSPRSFDLDSSLLDDDGDECVIEDAESPPPAPPPKITRRAPTKPAIGDAELSDLGTLRNRGASRARVSRGRGKRAKM